VVAFCVEIAAKSAWQSRGSWVQVPSPPPETIASTIASTSETIAFTFRCRSRGSSRFFGGAERAAMSAVGQRRSARSGQHRRRMCGNQGSRVRRDRAQLNRRFVVVLTLLLVDCIAVVTTILPGRKAFYADARTACSGAGRIVRAKGLGPALADAFGRGRVTGHGWQRHS
jgi:hypothetical protein